MFLWWIILTKDTVKDQTIYKFFEGALFRFRFKISLYLWTWTKLCVCILVCYLAWQVFIQLNDLGRSCGWTAVIKCEPENDLLKLPCLACYLNAVWSIDDAFNTDVIAACSAFQVPLQRRDWPFLFQDIYKRCTRGQILIVIHLDKAVESVLPVFELHLRS